MTIKKTLDGLNYREAQRRNSEKFNSFNSSDKQEIRKQGYKNVGWQNLEKSWAILNKFISKKQPIKLVNFAIDKAKRSYENAKQKGDMMEILESGKSVIQALKMKYQ